MNAKFAMFILIGTLVVMALYCSSTNFVSAETRCYISGEKRVCITTIDQPLPTQSNRDILPTAKALVLCDKDGTNCTVHWLDKVSVVTPEVKNAIKNAQIANLARDNVSDGNDAIVKSQSPQDSNDSMTKEIEKHGSVPPPPGFDKLE
jgi:hypothetical protein